MTQNRNNNEEPDGNAAHHVTILKYLGDNNYVIFYVIAFLIYLLAFGSEANLGLISYKGQTSGYERNLLIGIGTSFLFIAFFTHVRSERRRRITKKVEAAFENEEDPIDRIDDINQIIQKASSASREYQQALKPFSSIASEFENQRLRRSRIVEWMRKYPKSYWLNEVISGEFLDDVSPRYMTLEQESILREDIEQLLRILADSLEQGQPRSLHSCGFKRGIDSKYLYREAMKRMRAQIVASLKKARELEDFVEKAESITVDFMDVLIENLESDKRI